MENPLSEILKTWEEKNAKRQAVAFETVGGFPVILDFAIAKLREIQTVKDFSEAKKLAKELEDYLEGVLKKNEEQKTGLDFLPTPRIWSK